jgi:hypothetical protein
MKKIIEFLKKYQLIIVLAVIAGVLGGYKLFFAPQEDQAPGQITPTPSPSPIPTQSQEDGQGITEDEFVQDIVDQYPLTPHLPYPDEKYTIKYTDTLTIEVSVNQATESASQQEVLEWIEDQGVDPDSHTINWQF